MACARCSGSGQTLRHGSGQILRRSSGLALRHSSGQAGRRKTSKNKGKNQKCRRADIFHMGYTPCFCVWRGNKRVTDRDLVWRGIKRLRNEPNWSDKKTGISPTPGYRGCAGIIGLTGEARKCGNDWTWWIFEGGMEGLGVERENSPREHKGFSQIIASLSTVLCSTGTILRRKGNGKRRNGKVDSRQSTVQSEENATPRPRYQTTEPGAPGPERLGVSISTNPISVCFVKPISLKNGVSFTRCLSRFIILFPIRVRPNCTSAGFLVSYAKQDRLL